VCVCVCGTQWGGDSREMPINRFSVDNECQRNYAARTRTRTTQILQESHKFSRFLLFFFSLQFFFFFRVLSFTVHFYNWFFFFLSFHGFQLRVKLGKGLNFSSIIASKIFICYEKIIIKNVSNSTFRFVKNKNMVSIKFLKIRKIFNSVY
jgi:uncharacterized membrane protein YjjP (DUF1212 family)